MKKCLLILLIFVLLVPQTFASSANSLTVNTSFKQTVIEDGITEINGTTCLPLISVCEALGGVVYQTADSDSFYIISRDGDVISHTAGTAYYDLNGNSYTLPFASVKNSNVIVHASMIENCFGVTLTANESGLNITREMYTGYYNELVSRLMKYCLCGDFYPENFSRYFAFYCANPSMDAGVVINSVNIGLDKTIFTDAQYAPNPYASDVLINKLNRLPENFEAENLVSVDRLYSNGASHRLNEEAYYKYVDMYDAAASKGLRLKIVSSYRTEDYQRRLYNSYLAGYGKEYAEKYSAQPGYSEHQTGLAVDINSVYTTFENSKEYAWLKDHAHEFGFIERYKKGQEYITGYSYEPWHYRYVGIDAAKIIYQQGITFEEYYAVYLYKSDYTTDKDRTWINVINYYYPN